MTSEDHRLRPDYARGNAASEHPRDRLGAKRGAAAIGGREAVLLGEGVGDANDGKAGNEERETRN